ncbi:hypothetical protein [Paenibacillus sinopodophylli]|uniref:hypothetical protein n=1 Tax=Paenibacillus sinopodophylli TaxID=1837342 RepID=UPI00110CFEF6|nr:hypothetical protein [Paenibacillus sinopodophylli]
MSNTSVDEESEFEKLVKEKVSLATKLGIMGQGAVPRKDYDQTKEYRRISEIDVRLWELVK